VKTKLSDKRTQRRKFRSLHTQIYIDKMSRPTQTDVTVIFQTARYDRKSAMDPCYSQRPSKKL